MNTWLRGVKHCVMAWLSLISLTATAAMHVTPVNLNDFFADPSVSVAVDGTSALLTEDPTRSVVLLANDPGSGDPNVIVPGPLVSLLLDFDFIEGPAGDDEFSVFVLDGATGAGVGPGFEFLAVDSVSGSLNFDLSSLDGRQLGLQIQLSALFNDSTFDSQLTISNVRLEAVPIAVPGVVLLLSALTGLGALGIRRHGRQSG